MQAHEYSVVGHRRSIVGRWLFSIASVLASASVAVGVIIANVAAAWGLPIGIQNWLLAPASAAIVFGLVHFAFSKWGWKCLSWVGAFPNVSGIWQCKGQTMKNGNVIHDWEGEVSISQDWEKIRVCQATPQSTSYSVAASLLPLNYGCWLLMYSYRNQVRPGEPLQDHGGYCELRFSRDRNTAEGDYFTTPGRGTAGRMKLTRKG